MSQKTQCPNCQAIYPMPANKIGDSRLRATCKKCQQPFAPNEHLITEKTEAEKSKNAAAVAVASISAKNTPASQAGAKAITPAVSPTSKITTLGASVDENFSPPKTSTKRQKTTASNDPPMIFDDMDAPDAGDAIIENLDDELDKFLTKTLDIPTKQHISDNSTSINEEAWIDDLLNPTAPHKPKHPPLSAEITTRPKSAAWAKAKTSRTTPASTDSVQVETADVDLDDLIPAAKTKVAPAQAPETPKARRSLGMTIAWGVASLFLVAALGGQYVFFNNHAIAKKPSQAKIINAICHCLPSADPTSINIKHSIQSKGMQSNIIATLSNSSNTDQLYPNLKIIVSGANGLVGDLAVAPKDYLTTPQQIIAAGQSDRFMLTIPANSSDIHSIVIEPFY